MQQLWACTEASAAAVADFGIAKMLETTCGGATVIGTPQYMAPELYKGEKYGCSSDMWSLGVVVYEVCCCMHAVCCMYEVRCCSVTLGADVGNADPF